MKADISLHERQRLERERQAEIRAATVRRHFQVAEEQTAIAFALAHRDTQILSGLMADLERIAARPIVKAPVSAPVEPEPSPVTELPAPEPRRRAITATPGLRASLGLT